MAIRDDSYSSVAEVVPYVRYLLKGDMTFSPSTKPTLSEVEKFIDRASGVLNMSLKGAGFATPLNSTTATSTAVLLADDWVTMRVWEMVEMTHPGASITDGENARPGDLNLMAKNFVAENTLALKREGVTVNNPSSQGLAFTGLSERSERSDPNNTSREQPKFYRGMFDGDDD